MNTDESGNKFFMWSAVHKIIKLLFVKLIVWLFLEFYDIKKKIAANDKQWLKSDIK